MSDLIEHSCGIVPFCKIDEVWHVLLIQHKSAKYWGFPKGHPDEEKRESPAATAKRELSEETGLQVDKFLSQHPFEEHYTFKKGVSSVFKTVTYFAAVVSGTLTIQEEEVAAAIWLDLAQAKSCLTYDTDRAILKNILSSVVLS
jgi:8-oxo-dGTP pyrophosphatase MutT (NUDIX family)